MRDLIKIGSISSINYENGTVQVLFQDKDASVSKDLPLLSFEYNMPKVGDSVLCVFLPNGRGEGFCIGSYFNDNHHPVDHGEVYRKDFIDEAFIKYEKSTRTLTIYAENIKLIGNVIVDGDLSVNGNITVSGSINASNI